jgi:hypothetical protein
MSEILKQIREDLKTAMTTEVQLRKQNITSGLVFDAIVAQKTVSRAIISMFPEIGKKPSEGTDDDVIKLLKKYIGQEKERQLYIDKHLTEIDVKGLSLGELKKIVSEKIQELGEKLTSPNLFVAQKYLPKQATEEEVTSWISENLDLSNYKNKMQAMGPIMKQFKGCDGNFVKDILMGL